MRCSGCKRRFKKAELEWTEESGASPFPVTFGRLHLCEACVAAIARQITDFYGDTPSAWWKPREPITGRIKELPTQVMRLEVYRRDQFTCRYCSCHCESDDITIDHVDPDGPATMENLVTACRTCNNRKGRRLHWVPNPLT